MRPAPAVCVFRVVGTTFAEGYPATVDRLVDMLADGPVPARLHRVPSNEADPNAVAVVCVAAGGRIGWVPRGLAARYAPVLDAGVDVAVEIVEHVVSPANPHNPGLNARVTIKEPPCRS